MHAAVVHDRPEIEQARCAGTADFDDVKVTVQQQALNADKGIGDSDASSPRPLSLAQQRAFDFARLLELALFAFNGHVAPLGDHVLVPLVEICVHGCAVGLHRPSQFHHNALLDGRKRHNLHVVLGLLALSLLARAQVFHHGRPTARTTGPDALDIHRDSSMCSRRGRGCCPV